ncbi:MAG: radical SAM protein [Acidobacteria bacterium]|nr:radical SAM protein [Acidobacteriota bacterium]MSO83752.1 radical SAM protein [Acidobacteriota bacterium]
MRVILLSTYDLGRQPFGLASPAAWLKRAGFEVTCVDLSREKLTDDTVAGARLVAIYLPMHTATRLAMPVIARLRAMNPAITIAAYGLYAPLNEALLREHGVSIVLGPESEQELVDAAGASGASSASAKALPRLAFIQPDRSGLPALDRYASLQMPDGSRRVVGATDATRGCKHRCRHCPIVPVYDGQFRVVPVEVVLADVRAQVAQGAAHITFGDPDFFNGPTHARKLVEALHTEFPAITYDAIIKVEHLLQQRELLSLLASTGCLFVTSAVESVDDEVLAKLEKGHTRADFFAAATLCRAAGLTLVPTFVAFTPWTSLEGYRDLLDVVDELDLIANVAPVQWGIRLLVTWQSRLLELPDIRAVIGPFERSTLTFPWRHPDPRVDHLQQRLTKLVGVRLTAPRAETFEAIRDLAQSPRREIIKSPHPRTSIPYMNEPWYC